MMVMVEPLQSQGMSYYKSEDAQPSGQYQKTVDETSFPHEKLDEKDYVRIDAPGSYRKSRASENYVEQLAGKALSTLEGLRKSHQDGGIALRRALCEANRFSTTLRGPRRIWLPLWR